MALSFWELANLTDELEANSNKFCRAFNNLLKTFSKTCGKDANFVRLQELWILAGRVAGISTCAVSIAERINIYRDDILNERVDKLYNEDYSKHIIPGTQSDTLELITKLIDVFRSAWDKSDVKTRDGIKKYFKELASMTTLIIDLDKKINPEKK